MSKGLFERAISQSGTILNIWWVFWGFDWKISRNFLRSDVPRPGLAKMRAIRLTDMMKCPIANTNFKEMTECLRKVDAATIVEALFEFFVSLSTFSLKTSWCKRFNSYLCTGVVYRSSCSVSTRCREFWSFRRRGFHLRVPNEEAFLWYSVVTWTYEWRRSFQNLWWVISSSRVLLLIGIF